MKSSALCAALITFMSISGAVATSAACEEPGSDYELTFQDVPLRPNVVSDIHVSIYDNPYTHCTNRIMLAVHGAAATAATWEPMAQALFASPPNGKQICKIASMDLPGHGGSSTPEGILLGDLSLEDYVAALFGTIERMDESGLHVTTLAGHSMGAMVLQIAQQELANHGTSLRQEYGIKQALFLGPVPPKQIPSAYVQDPAVGQLLGTFVQFNPTYGLHFSIPDSLWPELVFVDIYGFLASTAPTGDEVTEAGYNSRESFTALSELVGIPPYERPDIDAGIFGDDNGTRLTVIAFRNDSVVRVEEGRATYKFLTGKKKSQHFSIVEAPDAVHGTPISEPGLVVDAIQRSSF